MAIQSPEQQKIDGMTLEDFLREYDAEPFELIDGEKHPIMAKMAGHDNTIRLLHEALVVYNLENRLFMIFVEATFILEPKTNWVKGSRQPDIAIYARERMEAYRSSTPDWQSKPYAIVPDICIEVISVNDLYLDVEAKKDLYFQDGVKQVWIVNPEGKTIAIHNNGSDTALRLTREKTLDGGDLLPGFSLPLKAVFPD